MEGNKRTMRERCTLRKDIIKEFLAEFLGTFILILFGCGSVAQTVLSRGELGEPLTIHIGFTLGVMLAVYVAGGVSEWDHNTVPPAPQVIGAAALILCILAITDKKNTGAPKGMEPLAVGLTILAIGVSMGLNCGYPINPARDLAPRLFTAMAGWGFEVFSAGNCWFWIPVAGPLVGGVVGATIYFLLIELHHPEPQRHAQDDNNVKEKYEIVTMS
ncbi:aquaporin-9b [Alosa sapidissima]|uniref:aquaporin-9b n=1 Tax=Alosa sapidissima TaxID=34773 RepID=UPI001C0937DC|nr:aquaporin-9b [Alosa sapidissima]